MEWTSPQIIVMILKFIYIHCNLTESILPVHYPLKPEWIYILLDPVRCNAFYSDKEYTDTCGEPVCI